MAVGIEKDYHPSEQDMKEAWWAGYRMGFDMNERDNPYEEDSVLSWEYDYGYNQGYAES